MGRPMTIAPASLKWCLLLQKGKKQALVPCQLLLLKKMLHKLEQPYPSCLHQEHNITPKASSTNECQPTSSSFTASQCQWPESNEEGRSKEAAVPSGMCPCASALLPHQRPSPLLPSPTSPLPFSADYCSHDCYHNTGLLLSHAFPSNARRPATSPRV